MTSTKNRRVIFDQDGSIDDFLSGVLLVTMPHIELLGIVVAPADCYLEPAVSANRKILDLLGRSDIPVVASDVRGVNAFPPAYRRDSIIVDHLPLLNITLPPRAPLSPLTGAEFMIQQLRASDRPVTLMMTGPLTTLAEALRTAPDIEAKIEEIVWMGGALDVPGNVERSIEIRQDGTAEWNVYWDAPAAAAVFATSIPITICPLDLTNRMPVTFEFIRRLTAQRAHPVSELAGLCYALVSAQDYFMWDVLATAYLGRPDLFNTTQRNVVIETSGRSQGRTIPDPSGRPVTVMANADLAGIQNYLLDQWRR